MLSGLFILIVMAFGKSEKFLWPFELASIRKFSNSIKAPLNDMVRSHLACCCASSRFKLDTLLHRTNWFGLGDFQFSCISSSEVRGGKLLIDFTRGVKIERRADRWTERNSNYDRVIMEWSLSSSSHILNIKNLFEFIIPTKTLFLLSQHLALGRHKVERNRFTQRRFLRWKLRSYPLIIASMLVEAWWGDDVKTSKASIKAVTAVDAAHWPARIFTVGDVIVMFQ